MAAGIEYYKLTRLLKFKVMNKNSNLNTVIKILHTRVQERTAEETELVKKYLLSLQFCKNLKLKEKHISDLLPNFKMLSAHPNQEIVRFGEIGDKFYINLRGKYAVWVPVLHIHILYFLEQAIKAIEAATDGAAKLRVIRSMNFKFKDHHMVNRP